MSSFRWLRFRWKNVSAQHAYKVGTVRHTKRKTTVFKEMFNIMNAYKNGIVKFEIEEQ